MVYPLSAAFRITLRTADTKDVDSSTIATEEASIVVAIGINSSNEAFRRSQGELHAVLATDLAH